MQAGKDTALIILRPLIWLCSCFPEQILNLFSLEQQTDFLIKYDQGSVEQEIHLYINLRTQLQASTTQRAILDWCRMKEESDKMGWFTHKIKLAVNWMPRVSCWHEYITSTRAALEMIIWGVLLFLWHDFRLNVSVWKGYYNNCFRTGHWREQGWNLREMEYGYGRTEAIESDKKRHQVAAKKSELKPERLLHYWMSSGTKEATYKAPKLNFLDILCVQHCSSCYKDLLSDPSWSYSRLLHAHARFHTPPTHPPFYPAAGQL